MHRMRRIAPACLPFLAFALVVALALVPGSAGAVTFDRAPVSNLVNPRVLPPQSAPYGHSYGEWSVKWWQWAYGLPVAGHPLFDESGAECAAGQSGPVWFLGGVFNVSGTVVRTECVVPAGKALYFPIVNVEWDNVCPPGSLTIDELRAQSKWFMDLATGLQCEVDGRSLGGLAQYRFTEDPFWVDMPEGNIFQFFGCDAPAGHYGPMLPDGYFVMLAPLSPGTHTIHFKGTIGDPVNFTPEATYELTVLPSGQWLARGLPASALDGTAPEEEAAITPRTTWGQLKAIYR